jgi:hypothetical protein
VNFSQQLFSTFLDFSETFSRGRENRAVPFVVVSVVCCHWQCLNRKPNLQTTKELFKMPKYAALIYGPDEAPGTVSPEEWASAMVEYNDFGAAAGAAGVLVGGEALQGIATATTVHVKGGAKGGEMVLTDGPFAETKEVLGGFYLLDCKDLDEAVKWAAQIPGAWHGRVEVRPCVDFTQG